MKTTFSSIALPRRGAGSISVNQQLVFNALLRVAPTVQFEVPAVELVLDLRSIDPIDVARERPASDAEYSLQRHHALSVVKVIAGPAFMKTFLGVENDGEHTLLTVVLAGLKAMQSVTDATAMDVSERATLALGGTGAKVLHTFESHLPVEALLVARAGNVFERPDEHVGASRLRAFEDFATLRASEKLSPQESCGALNSAVTFLMNKIAGRLKRFDRKALVSHLLFLHETQVYDRQQWRSTARAVQALYGAEGGRTVAQEAESIRAEISVTLRTLIEAAVCETSTNGGLPPDEFSVDDLYGLMCTLITLGRDSDTIYHGMASSGIRLYPSGAYAFSADVFHQIGVPYANQTFASGYAEAAAGYEDWVLPSEEASELGSNPFNDRHFHRAFQAEYRMDFLAFTGFVAALIDRFVELHEVVLEFTRIDLIELAATREIAIIDVDAFLDSFALPARETWAPQVPVRARDVEPWRFERRLSVMLRPAVACLSEDVTYYSIGVGTLQGSVTYLLDSIANGRFDKDVFISTEMRSFLGKRVDEAGRAFTYEVASRLRELGWSAKEEVKMSELGSGKTPNLGDVDVLAWNSAGHVMAIECKRLKNARTVTEIAQSCARFAGREGDHLHKHLRRVAWLRGNRDKVAKYLGIDPASFQIENPLVTNVEVPFAYVRNLPLPMDRIVPISALSDFVSNLFSS